MFVAYVKNVFDQKARGWGGGGGGVSLRGCTKCGNRWIEIVYTVVL